MRGSPYPLAMKTEPSGAGTAAVRRHSLGVLNPASRGAVIFITTGTVGLHLYKEPVLCGRAFLHGRIEELLSVLLGVNHRMNFGIRVCYGPDQTPAAVVDDHSSSTLRADIDVARIVLGDGAMRASEAHARRERPPTRYNFIGPFAIASQGRRRIGPIGSCRNKWGKNGLSCCDSRHAHERTPVELCHWMLLTPLSAVGAGSAGVLKRYR